MKTSSAFSCVNNFPPELYFQICAAVYHAGIPPSTQQALDPVLIPSDHIPTGLPSSYPASHWPEPLTRRTLANLCLVNHAFYDGAKPWLWRKIEVRLPQSWLALVDEIGGGDGGEVNEEVVEVKIKQAASAALAAAHVVPGPSINGGTDEATRKMQESILASLSGPESSIPLDLLTPPASREPSPRRIRAKSKSPARWKIMRSINDAVQNVVEQGGSSFYVPTPFDSSPGKHIWHLDFNHFRTIGMRRSVGEGVSHRFVTGERLELLLKESPNLITFGGTEYMDSALTVPVLKELFLRGSPSRGRGRPSRGRSLIVNEQAENEEMDRERRRECKDLVAIDLTGCVSAVFVNALTEFVTTYINTSDNSESPSATVSDDEQGNTSPNTNHHANHTHVHFQPQQEQRHQQREPLSFPGLQRLGLRGVKSIHAEILNPFVLAFPSLTHLDLSGTRVTPDLLEVLGASPTVRLCSLGISRCTRLTGTLIANFLIYGQAARGITELTVYGDPTFPSSLTEDDVEQIFKSAPAFTSGQLEYLDLSSSPVTAEHLKLLAPQPRLRSLGLSYLPELSLSAIADFILHKAPCVEILSIISSAPELDIATGVTARQASMALHMNLIRPLCTAPFRFSLSSSPWDSDGDAPTRLRVVELSTALLNRLGAGADAWRIVRSKGGRGWYVDTSTGWLAEPGLSMRGYCERGVNVSEDGAILKRGLPREHPLRIQLERLADANGNVSSGVGWHARKLEILQGHGLLGREDGLYGAVSFAYQG